jgi:cytochrome P450
MPLARMETTVAINALLDRLPDLHLDPTAPAPVIKGVAFRSPAALPVEFNIA